MNSRNSIPGALALLAATICTSAIAGPAQVSPPTQIIAFADLNLNSPAGVARLYRRIQRAADQVCEFPPDLRELRAVRESKSCKARAMERAVIQVDIPALHALHLAKTARHSRSGRLANNQ